MKQATNKKSNAWFWLGVILLSISGGLWAVIITVIITEGDGEGVLWGIIFTVIPMAIGFYGIRRGRYPERPWEWWAWTAIIVLISLVFLGSYIGLVVAVSTFDLSRWLLFCFVPMMWGFFAMWHFIGKFRERALKKEALVIKSLERSEAMFSMQLEEVFRATFTTGVLGMVVGGRVEQGTIRNGDDVEIRGRGHTRKAKVFEVDTLSCSGAQGERVRLLIEDLTENDVKLGDLVEKV